MISLVGPLFSMDLTLLQGPAYGWTLGRESQINEAAEGRKPVLTVTHTLAHSRVSS